MLAGQPILIRTQNSPPSLPTALKKKTPPRKVERENVEAPRRRRHAEPNRRHLRCHRDPAFTGHGTFVRAAAAARGRIVGARRPRASMSGDKLKVKTNPPPMCSTGFYRFSSGRRIACQVRNNSPFRLGRQFGQGSYRKRPNRFTGGNSKVSKCSVLIILLSRLAAYAEVGSPLRRHSWAAATSRKYLAPLCSTPVDLQSTFMPMENGKAVHEDCYVKHLTTSPGNHFSQQFSDRLPVLSFAPEYACPPGNASVRIKKYATH